MHAVKLSLAREHAVVDGSPRSQTAVVVVASDAPITEAQRERGIRRHIVAVDREQQVREACLKSRLRGIDLALPLLVGKRQRSNRTRRLDRGVARFVDGLGTSSNQLFEKALVAQLTLLDQLLDGGCRAAIAKQHPKIRIIGGQVVAGTRQVIGKQRLLHGITTAIDVPRTLRIIWIASLRKLDQRLRS